MQTYWSSLFIIPKKVMKEIDSILRAFFWSSHDLKKTSAKLSWEHLCSPVKEGGLGFKSLEVWNKAVVAKHIWFLVSGGEQSMWCQWVKSYLLKDKSFWSVKIPCDFSWVWRKHLNLRSVVQAHIKYKIGDAQSTSLWFDNWHLLGPLSPRFGPRVIYDSRLPKDSTVKDIIRSNHWASPTAQSPDLNEIRSDLQTIPINDSIGDSCLWTLTASSKFTISSLWDHLRTHFPVIIWCKVVWFSRHIPRCSEISWMTILNKLVTEDRLVKFGVVASVTNSVTWP
ncbi:hypothetical protein RHMOL_Rhmol05G0159100 [Rhododendron molle]|nr:hypothetical protein RHMOL_Rhmol05G0159100 [Rhododendron molle]